MFLAIQEDSVFLSVEDEEIAENDYYYPSKILRDKYTLRRQDIQKINRYVCRKLKIVVCILLCYALLVTSEIFLYN